MATSFIDPVAQTFFVDAATYPKGMFVHSVDLVFKKIAKDLFSEEDETFSEINEVTKKQIIGILSYLTQSCLSIFNNLKSKYKELIEYNIVLDDNTTIYLDINNSKRIGIVFQNFINEKVDTS